jgi:hypothetical protein
LPSRASPQPEPRLFAIFLLAPFERDRWAETA